MRVPQRFVRQPTTERSPVFTGVATIALPDVEASDFNAPVDGTRIGTPAVGIGHNIPIGNPPPTRIATVATSTVEPPAGPVKIHTDILASKLITKVIPEYPAAAKAVHAAGVVRLLAVVGVDGHVKQLLVVEGHPLLRRAAEDAVRRWVYSPTYLNGRPVEVEASIEVNFALN